MRRAIMRRLVCLAAIYAIAVQALLGAWLGAANAAPAAASAPVMLCGAALGGAGPDPTQSGHMPDCPCMALCAIGASAALPPPDAGIAPGARVVHAIRFTIAAAQVAHVASDHALAEPRGPPIDV
jgi:hypothetical protein